MFIAQNAPVPGALLSEPKDSSELMGQPLALASRFASDGYLYLAGVLDKEAIAGARLELLETLAGVDEIEHPAGAGIATGRSQRKALHPDLGAFWRARSESPMLRAVTHGGVLARIAGALFAEPARAFDFLFLRVGTTGRFTHIHCDSPFFTRSTERIVTAWIALSDVPPERGPLFLIAGSHRWAEVEAAVAGYDVARDKHRRAAWPDNPADLARRRNTHLISKGYSAGDLVFFGMHLLHGAFDHCDVTHRVRVSCDVRFQPQSQPCDPRYFGENPGGTTGAGYGELNGAKPLTEDWHIR
jgi:hypothetical protein